MEVTVALFLMLLLFAFLCEFIDSSIGMGYGTILTPTLLIFGFHPLVVIPAVLLSQAFGGLSASVFHHQFRNATFNRHSKDFKAVIIITGFGLLATIFAAIVSVNLPKSILNSYIGILVLMMGVIVLSKRTFKFSWRKLTGIGLLSAFNKGISGGGFGPVVTGGQLMAGQEHKVAIAVTTFAEAPICIAGFFTYIISRSILEIDVPVLNMPVSEFFQLMFSHKIFQWELFLALVTGSVLVTPFGAFTTKVINARYLTHIVGSLMVLLGFWTLYKVWF